MDKKLSELDFVDLYVCLDGDGKPHYRTAGNDMSMQIDSEVPTEYCRDLEGLITFLRMNFNFKDDEMGLAYEGMRLRAARANMASGQVWASLRRIKDTPTPLEKLGFMPSLVPHLSDLGKRDGLILICGSTAQGKTTTSCSMLSHFLDQYGGVAFTIEDPVEYFLEGRRGKHGYCYQVEVREDPEWAQMVKRSLRWHPRYIFVGEVRTPDTANQLLRAASSGHLVITTIHAGSIEEGLEGILHLAEQSIGERANILLASSLTAVIHQTISPMGLNARFMITEPNNFASASRAVIRDNRIGQIKTMADQQIGLLMQSGKIFRDQ